MQKQSNSPKSKIKKSCLLLLEPSMGKKRHSQRSNSFLKGSVMFVCVRITDEEKKVQLLTYSEDVHGEEEEKRAKVTDDFTQDEVLMMLTTVLFVDDDDGSPRLERCSVLSRCFLRKFVQKIEDLIILTNFEYYSRYIPVVTIIIIVVSRGVFPYLWDVPPESGLHQLYTQMTMMMPSLSVFCTALSQRPLLIYLYCQRPTRLRAKHSTMLLSALLMCKYIRVSVFYVGDSFSLKRLRTSGWRQTNNLDSLA